MSKAAKAIFGGSDRTAQRKTEAQNNLSREFIQKQMGQGQQALSQGFGGAYNLLSGAIPQQAQAFQQGNMAAQNYLIGGMPAFQNAIMGGPMNYGKTYSPQPFQMQIPQMNTQQFAPQFNPLAGGQ